MNIIYHIMIISLLCNNFHDNFHSDISNIIYNIKYFPANAANKTTNKRAHNKKCRCYSKMYGSSDRGNFRSRWGLDVVASDGNSVAISGIGCDGRSGVGSAEAGGAAAEGHRQGMSLSRWTVCRLWLSSR